MFCFDRALKLKEWQFRGRFVVVSLVVDAFGHANPEWGD